MGTSSPAIRALSAPGTLRIRLVAGLVALLCATAATFAVRDLTSVDSRGGAPVGSDLQFASRFVPRVRGAAAQGAARTAQLPAGGLAAISARLGGELPAFAVHRDAPAGFSASIPDQGLETRFSAGQTDVRAGSESVSLALGKLDGLRLSARAVPRLRSQRVRYAYPNLTAWYANGPLGLEQGFTVRRPARETTLTIATAGSAVHRSGAGLTFGRQLRYSDVRAHDAAGHRLRAWLTLTGSRITIHVDSAGAHFPISIDPLVQSATLEPSSIPSGLDNFGVSVAISGNLLVVGDPTVGGTAPEPAAYVFMQGQDGWSDATQVAELTASSPTGAFAPGGFGTEVAISANGESIAVSAPQTTLSGTTTGAVFMYDEPGTPANIATGWVNATQSSSIFPIGATANEAFGTAMSLTDDELLVGAPGADAGAGEAFLYDEPPAGWTQSTKPTDFPGTAGEQLGQGVVLSSDDATMVLGAPGATVGDAPEVGEVQVLTEPSQGWGSAAAATAVLTPSDPNAASSANNGSGGDDELGTAVAISADAATVAAGATGQAEDNGTSTAGAVDVFVKPSGGWTNGTQTAELYDGDTADAQGESLGRAISFAGTSVIAGAEGYGDGAGALYEFDQPSGGWSSEARDPAAGPTFAARANSVYGESVAGDGDTVVVGETGGDDFVGSALVYGYTPPAPASTTQSTTTPTTTTQSVTALTTSSVASTTPVNPTQAPSPVSATPPTPTHIDFGIAPNAEPVLVGQQLTFSATQPESGVDYAWSFDDHSTASGATVTHAFAGAGVDTVTLTASINGQSVGTASHSVIVVQAQPPDADLTVLRTDQQGGNGASSAVTDPVTIVPDASLPQVDATAQDQITKIEYWFDSSDASGPTVCLENDPSRCVRTGAETADLTCLPDGSCGHYSGDAAVPTAADLTPVAGVTDLGQGAVWADGSSVAPAGCRLLPRISIPGSDPACTTYSPSAGFPAIQINFWDAALAQIGSGTNSWASTPEIPVGPQREAIVSAPNAQGVGTVSQPPETVPYPAFSQLDRAAADGYQGEQGVPDADCFPGDDYLTGGCAYGNNPFAGGQGPAAEAGDNYVHGLYSTVFGPFDLAHYGVNSPQQLEDQWNLLYNYATVVGVDTPLDSAYGPATGATDSPTQGTVPRTVTMVAYNAEGVPSAEATESVPLTPASNPSFSVCIEDVSGHTPCVIAPQKGPLPFTINTGDELKFEVDGAGGGSEPVSTYAIAVGQPNTASVKTSVGTVNQCVAPDGVGSWMSVPNAAPASSTTDANTGGGGSSSSSSSSHPIQKNTPDGPARRGRLDIGGTGLATTGTSVPPFSDLEAGAFPTHDCDGYSERTVDAAAAPGAAPSSGPTVTLHAALAQRRGQDAHPPVAPQTAIGDTYPDLSAATVPVATTPAPTEATGDPQTSGQAPILITSNADKLDFGFAKSGTYSASLAGYDSAGLGAITRIDGFLVQKALNYGFCVSVQSQAFAIPVHNGPAQTVGFSGNCMTVIAHRQSNGTLHDELYASTQPIDVNGIPVAPAPGDTIVISTDTDSFYVTGSCAITQAELTEQIGGQDGHANPCPDTHTGDLYLALGTASDSGQALPGFARIADFSTQQAFKYLMPLTDKALPAVGSTPAAGSQQEQDDVSGCGLYGLSQQWTNAPGAKYDGFPIASTVGPCVALSGYPSGTARVAFWDSLPAGFSNGASTKPDSSQVMLYGSDLPAVSDLSDNPYVNVALRQRSRHEIAGDFPVLHATSANSTKVRADDELPGFPAIPDCPPSTDGKSGLSIPDDTSLGPISLAGASFCYVASTGDFIGNVDVSIPFPAPVSGVEVGFEIGHGQLIDAGGELSGNIPIFPGVLINSFKFDVQTDPTEVAAAITASIVDLLDVQGGVIVKPDLPEVDFEGDVGLAGITFGNFQMAYSHKGEIGMSVAFGKDFGPASLNISIKGALSTSPAAFYLEGQGEACLFLCLGVEGLVSNEGLAACGSINLLLVSFSGGFAVQWSGPDSGVHLFTGCDLNPWIPASLANVPGTGSDRVADDPGRTARSSPHDTPQPTLSAGDSEVLSDVHQTGMCPISFVPPAGSPQGEVFTPPSAPGGCTTQTEAIQVHSLYDPSDPGATPMVELTNAEGDTRTPATPTTPGYWGLDATAAMSGGDAATPDDDSQTDGSTWLVDQNPVPTSDDNSDSSAYCVTAEGSDAASAASNCPKVTTTTIYIGDPGPGDWTLHVLPGSEPVVDVSTANEMPPVTPAQVGTAVQSPVLTGTSAHYAIHIAHRTFSGGDITSHRVLLSPSVEMAATSSTAMKQLATDPKPADLDVAPIDASLLRSIDVKLPTSFPGTAAIIDQGNGCADPNSCSQVLASGLTAHSLTSTGVPVLFEPFTTGTTQTIKAFISNSAGVPSKVITLATIHSPTTPRPAAPILEKVLRDGSVVHLYVNIRNTPPSGSIALALSASDGAQYDKTFPLDNGSVTPVASSPYTGISAARQHTEWEITVPDVDPTSALHVALAGLNGVAVGASSSQHPVKALLPGLTDRQLQSKLPLTFSSAPIAHRGGEK